MLDDLSVPSSTEQYNLSLADALADGGLRDYEEQPFGDDTARRRILAKARRDLSEEAMDNWLWWVSLPEVRFEGDGE